MNIAVFVDAGYLYALCSMARFRAPQPRVRLDLDIDTVVRQLKSEVAALDGGGGRLIRIYWYDGAPKAGMTADQARIAASADVKLRLGSVNSYGEQKGVDALIAHDLSELARNRAIDAAILVSGDEDILVGVQTAQTFGVRVHLLGIDPMHSQAQRLRNEADVCHEWPEGLVAPWLALKPGLRTYQGTGDDEGGYEPWNGPPVDMQPVLEGMYPVLEGREYAVLDLWDRANRIARDVDSQLMRLLSSVLGRQLSPQEKPALRQAFVDSLRARIEPAADAAEFTDDDALASPAGDDFSDESGASPVPEISPESIAEIAASVLPEIGARLSRILENWDTTGRLPVDVNVRLLKTAREIAGAEIENRGALRNAFVDALRAAVASDDTAEAQPEIGTADTTLPGDGERAPDPEETSFV